MNAGKCPHCGNIIRTANLERINIQAGIGGATFVGVSYVCPHAPCGKVLGVSIDPIAIQNDIESEIRKQLKARLP